MSNLRIRLTEEVRHMPIVVGPEDIRLPKRKLRKDILYRLGLEEGEVIGIEKGLLKSAQDMVIAIVEGKLGYVPEGLEEKVREIKDREFLHALIKKLIGSEKLLDRELKLLPVRYIITFCEISTARTVFQL